ncbi:PAS domain-containing sensor histidine kinase [Methanoculleus sp.]|uniref:PAS domain-containing sensor histidine kinase n=1 Tax=Methanoculleus sp. TaxID=90427 RepID=UPI0025F55707|nr:PAS domain-containing sensor histidine kinase [Methanoculleus sp.]
MPLNRCLAGLFRKDLFTGTDIVKMIVLVSFSLISFMLTAVEPANAHPVCPLIYCIPILFAALWFPRQALPVTVLLVLGFVFIRVFQSTLGFIIDPVMTGLHSMIFFWVFGATTLFSHDSRLAFSRYRQLVENSHDAKFLCDPKTLQLLCVSRRCADILGYAPQELIGVPVEFFWADVTYKVRFTEEMEREGYIGSMGMTLRARNGDVRPVFISCRKLVPENLFECTIADAGMLQNEREDLVRSNGRLTELIHQSNDIFFMQDPQGRILHFSWLRASEHHVSPDDLVGRGVDALLPADLAVQHMERVHSVVRERKNARYDLDIEIGGVCHTYSVTLAPYAGADGALIGVVGSARDNTEMRRQRLACRQMAWEVDQWKGLVATLSHELRTPLQPLIGYLCMIADDPECYGLTAETERCLRTCIECAKQEQAVVERMVELSLVTMDHVELAIQDVPLRPFVDGIITDGGYGREAEIENEIPVNAHIWGDPVRLCLAVESLVSNAVKYNELPKKVWIRYAESNNNHYIMVCDNGIGIPGDIIGSIFRPFYTGGIEQQNRKSGKTGLGLAIANKYVQLHGGEITVTSVVGEGSTFTIRIPREV